MSILQSTLKSLHMYGLRHVLIFILLEMNYQESYLQKLEMIILKNKLMDKLPEGLFLRESLVDTEILVNLMVRNFTFNNSLNELTESIKTK